MKKLLSVITVLVLLFCVTGCEAEAQETLSPSASPTPTEKSMPTPLPSPIAKPIVLQYNISENEQHPQGICMLAFKEKIEELSGGQIKIEVYPSDSLYCDGADIPALIFGDLDMCHIAFQDISPWLPTAEMFYAPYIFTSYEHMEKVFAQDSPIAKDFFQRISEEREFASLYSWRLSNKAYGFTPLAYMTQGSRMLNLTIETPIIKPEDLTVNNVILRMPGGEVWLNVGRSLGADVKGVAYAEIYTALQNGKVNANDNPLPGIYAMKFYEVTKQISLTRHVIQLQLICVSNKVRGQMTEQQREWMYEAAQYAADIANEVVYAQERLYLQFMKDQGLVITEPDIDAFQAHSLQYYIDNGLTKDWDMEMYDAIQAMK